MRKYTLILLCLLASLLAHAGNYTVKKGEKLTLRCTATPPAGTITHAVFEVANPEDTKYLSLLEYDTREQTATFVGIQAKANIKVRVTYYYSYRGTYSGNMEVGHGSYTDNVTVQGGTTPKKIEINPSKINMKIGETVTAQIVLTPSNADADYDIGYVETLSSPPSYFQWSCNNGLITITAKKAGSLYLIAQVSDKIVGTCSVRATKDGGDKITPTSVEVSPVAKPLAVGQSVKLEYEVLPMGASSELTWKVSDESVATVSTSGIVTAKKEGEVQITATTSNGLASSINLTVTPKVQNIKLPSSGTVALGYAYQLNPTITPSSASVDLAWSSSDTSIARVSATGRVTCYKEGNVTITAQQGNDLKTSVELTVVSPSGMDAINAATRVAEIEAIANRILLNIK